MARLGENEATERIPDGFTRRPRLKFMGAQNNSRHVISCFYKTAYPAAPSSFDRLPLSLGRGSVHRRKSNSARFRMLVRLSPSCTAACLKGAATALLSR